MPGASISSARGALFSLFSEAGIPLPHLEADRIICGTVQASRAFLHAHPERRISARDFSLIMERGARRASGAPMAYVLGDSYFCGRKFLVDESVLIPRTETEILTERAGEFLKSGARVFADWCSGSGAIAITLLAECDAAEAYAVDASARSLIVAERNAKLHGVAPRLKFIECCDPLGAAGEMPLESLDMAVANPPYIPTSAIASLEPQVRDHEPLIALDGGRDGLDVCRLLLSGVPRYMKPGAPLFLETGGGPQTPEVARLAEELAPELELKEIFEDHRGIYRFMQWRKVA
ncbi:MAG: peptide chain release factor N(5)-glutamine methyltransferase [Synergistaceae bacterium]|jgi:release factor glutamine methyltransferase|nr:peptide chain release factor N(5)-glutamine methyltransferase [Synergistaceae bacterium]